MLSMQPCLLYKDKKILYKHTVDTCSSYLLFLLNLLIIILLVFSVLKINSDHNDYNSSSNWFISKLFLKKNYDYLLFTAMFKDIANRRLYTAQLKAHHFYKSALII